MPEYVKPSLRKEVAERALAICREERLPANSLAECLEAIIREYDSVRKVIKLLQKLEQTWSKT